MAPATTSKQTFKIDEVSRQSGLTKRTIRFYEDIGILPPPERTQGGTRRYIPQHIELLNKIIRMKEVLGFSLEEIQKFMKLTETLDNYREGYRSLSNTKNKTKKLHEIIQVIDEQLALIESKINKIRKAKNELLSLKKRADAAMAKLITNGES